MGERHDLSTLLDSLTQEGILDSHGGFTLDPGKILKKVQEFKFARSHQYLLCLYRGAVLGEATRIEVRVDADDLVLSFPGPALEAQQIRYLVASSFVTESSYCARKLQHLAWGLHGAWQEGYAQADVLSPCGAFRFLPGRAEPEPLQLPLPQFNEFRFKRKAGPKVLQRYLSRSRLPEREVFEYGLGWSGISTFFNGELMPGLRAPEGQFSVHHGLPASMALYYRGRPTRLDFARFLPPPFGFPERLEYSIVFDLLPEFKGECRVIVADVEAGRFSLDDCPGMRATVATSTLQLDASLTQAVVNQEFEQIRNVLHCAWLAALLEMARTPEGRTEAQRLIARALQGRSPRSTLEERVRQAFWNEPLVGSLDGRLHSLESLRHREVWLPARDARVPDRRAERLTVARRLLPLLRAAQVVVHDPDLPDRAVRPTPPSRVKRVALPTPSDKGEEVTSFTLPRVSLPWVRRPPLLSSRLEHVHFDQLAKRGMEIALPRPSGEPLVFALSEHEVRLGDESRSMLHITRCQLEKHERLLVLALFWKSQELRLAQSTQGRSQWQEALRRVQILQRFLPGRRSLT